MAVNKNLDKLAYSFFKFDDTDEIHIFEGKFTPDNCTAKNSCICGKINRKDDNVQLIIKCLDEDEARNKAAELGRNVCGVCVSNLYTTY